MPMNSDICLSFYLMNGLVLGHLCKVNTSINDALKNHVYPVDVQKILAEMVAMSQCFIANLKSDSKATMQITGTFPVSSAVVNVRSNGSFRCCATLSSDKITSDNSLDLNKIFGKEKKLLFTVNFDYADYQTLVPAQHNTLQEIFQTYFDSSEQIPSVVLSTSNFFDGNIAASVLILQKMPEAPTNNIETASEQSEIWEMAKLFASTIKKSEMLNSEQASFDFIKLVFRELNPVVSRETILNFSCACTKEKLQNLLDNLELKNEKLEIRCEFCNKTYYTDTQNKVHH